MRCPQHDAQQPDDGREDHWRSQGADRCCSYCGSWHPDEFLNFLHVAADPNQPGRIEHATKDYKIYVHRPGVANASEGAIKFYKWHLPQEIDEATQVVYREAMEVSFRKMMAATDRLCLDMGMTHPPTDVQT